VSSGAWPWSMFATFVGAASLITIWYFNSIRPFHRKEQLKKATKSYFLIPASTQHPCNYAEQDDEHEHTLTELSLPPSSEMIIDLIMKVRQPISFSEMIVGFKGNPGQKPVFTKYHNRYIKVGKGREVDPQAEEEDDYIDKHQYYHRKVARSVSADIVLSFAFTIRTNAIGLFPLHVLFISERQDRRRLQLVRALIRERHKSNKSPWITRNERRRFAGVGVGLVGTALSAASISSATDHTRSVIPSAIAGVIRKASCVRQRL
jgi:hypothetical protein